MCILQKGLSGWEIDLSPHNVYGDIVYVVSMASRYLANPCPQHLRLAHRILRYLEGTKSLNMAYKGQFQGFRGFIDADWPGCRSTTGCLFNIRSGAISWQSKRQSTVALSTCEAEFMGQTEATKEAIRLRKLLHELNMSQRKGRSSYVVTIKEPLRWLRALNTIHGQSTWISNENGSGASRHQHSGAQMHTHDGTNCRLVSQNPLHEKDLNGFERVSASSNLHQPPLST